ncbi:hypothetical protein BCR32DRAFT_307705 [Anaeromyces robustus]|uniref:Uncharacterized protein n=1 Tax=Anaeromyces robustus TaxID=1754192 RepID=A0A1Y1VRL5_9FUNG|nr:hypothetical protein BCR32DRAFT_307705 [Anaeromyces robustus]|eukprot:ORX63404.1 hypothetical protein BCR32DRAFT_307705 [Anaeromyces robustus]
MDVLVESLRQLNMKTKYNKTESYFIYNYLCRDKEIVMVTEIENHEFIIIEIQFPKTGNMFKRSLFHASGVIFHSLSSRKKYEEIPNILFLLDPNNDYFRTEKTPTYFLKARETLYELSKDKYIRESYKQITKQWPDIKSAIYNSYLYGIKEGRKEGAQLRSIKVAMISILNNVSIDIIIDLTELSKEDINYLKTLIDNKEYNIDELESKFNIEHEDFDKICI